MKKNKCELYSSGPSIGRQSVRLFTRYEHSIENDSIKIEKNRNDHPLRRHASANKRSSMKIYIDYTLIHQGYLLFRYPECHSEDTTLRSSSSFVAVVIYLSCSLMVRIALDCLYIKGWVM